jgi:hypothetical protein
MRLPPRGELRPAPRESALLTAGVGGEPQVLCACGKAPDPGPQALLCGVTEGTRHATARVRAESCSAVLTVLDSAHFRTLGGDDQVELPASCLQGSGFRVQGSGCQPPTSYGVCQLTASPLRVWSYDLGREPAGWCLVVLLQQSPQAACQAPTSADVCHLTAPPLLVWLYDLGRETGGG